MMGVSVYRNKCNACNAGVPVSKARHDLMFHVTVKDHQCIASWRHKRHLLPTDPVVLPARLVVQAQLAAIEIVIPA